MTSALLNGHETYTALPREVLEALRPGEMDPFVNPLAQARAMALASQLPFRSHTVCYECRLSPDETRGDLALCLYPGFSRGLNPELSALRRHTAGDPRWQRALDFLQDWERSAIAGPGLVPFICVAFDLDDPAMEWPVPAVSLCVDRHFFARELGLPTPPDGQDAATELCDFARVAFRTLAGQEMSAETERRLERAAAGVIVRHFSFMLGRNERAFKMDVRVPLNQLGSYLRRIEWPDAPDDIEAAARRLMPHRGNVQVNLVLHPVARRPLELEFLIGRAGEVTAAERDALMDRLVDIGLCSPARARAARDCWARPVSRDQSGAVVARGGYVKVRFDGARPVDAKIYLAFMPRLWRRDSGFRDAVAGEPGKESQP